MDTEDTLCVIDQDFNQCLRENCICSISRKEMLSTASFAFKALLWTERRFLSSVAGRCPRVVLQPKPLTPNTFHSSYFQPEAEDLICC